MWVRGLKQEYQVATTYQQKSHPVWVRGLKLGLTEKYNVKMRSHPVWVRGLKLISYRITLKCQYVAPRVGAWIETQGVATLAASMMSHPVWVRGLKLFILTIIANFVRSHPVWVRGLKLAISDELSRANRRTPCGCVD